jgi:hypothetical protein
LLLQAPAAGALLLARLLLALDLLALLLLVLDLLVSHRVGPVGEGSGRTTSLRAAAGARACGAIDAREGRGARSEGEGKERVRGCG